MRSTIKNIYFYLVTIMLLATASVNAQFVLQAPNSTDENNYRWYEASDAGTVLGTDSSYEVFIPGVYFAVYDGTMCGHNATTYFIVTYCGSPNDQVTLNIADNVNTAATVNWSPPLSGDQLAPVVTSTEAIETYIASVTKAGCTIALPSFTVVCLYEVFELIDDDVATPQNTSIEIDVVDNDIAIPPIGVFTIPTLPSNGSVTINDNGTPTDPRDDTIIYTPDNGFSGVDTFEYELEIINSDNTTMTDTAIVTVTVNPGDVIDAVIEDFTSTDPLDGISGGTTTSSVFDNDTLNSNPVSIEVDITVTINDANPTDGVTLNPNGTITVDPGTLPGVYTIEYTICSVADPLACDTTTVTVTVGSVVAQNDDFSSNSLNPLTGGVAGNVFGNDIVNGNTADATNVASVTILDDDGLTGVNIDSNGNVLVPAGTTPGVYSIIYEICNASGVCDSATVVITVGIDTDGDGILDFADLDDDNDGIIDALEGADDSDNDGIIDSLDIDSDNDGIPDNVEAQLTDVYVEPTGFDSDGDGLDDAYDTDDLGLDPVDTDEDGLPDYIDLDSDNDDLLDSLEAWDFDRDLIPDFTSTGIDSDNDGLDDGYEGINTLDGFDVNDELNNGASDTNDGNNNSVPDFREVLDDDLTVFQLITPNGDGRNDVLEIENIQYFPNNSVQIFNRWGVLVWETRGYDSNTNYFDGRSNGRVTIKGKEQLPVGTYYYVINYEDNNRNNKQKAGHIYINR